MLSTSPLLKEHSEKTNDVIVEYLNKFKNSREPAERFFKQVKDKFEGRLIEFGSGILGRSLTDDHYELLVAVKKINHQASQNLMAALVTLTKIKY